MPAPKAMQTYLNDHLAGASAGTELANKIASENAGSPRAVVLDELARDIAQDRETLVELMDRLGIARNPVKQAAGWLIEKVSRLKLSAGEQDLKLLLELETLSLGVEGKLAMWLALRDVRDLHAGLAGTDLDGLAKRAERQRELLEDGRREVARRALSP